MSQTNVGLYDKNTFYSSIQNINQLQNAAETLGLESLAQARKMKVQKEIDVKQLSNRI